VLDVSLNAYQAGQAGHDALAHRVTNRRKIYVSRSRTNFFTGLLQSRLTKVFTKHVIAYIISVSVGGIAQLGERLHGMQEVSGSIPLTSTNCFFG
jgi:hypothetical protein